jgi:hypothetical protein
MAIDAIDVFRRTTIWLFRVVVVAVLLAVAAAVLYVTLIIFQADLALLGRLFS